MPEAVIVSAARSPIGRANKGSLTELRPDDLTATIVQAALAKVPELDPATIENVLFARPFHLDYFSVALAANGWRLAAALGAEVDRTQTGSAHPDAGGEYSALDIVFKIAR